MGFRLGYYRSLSWKQRMLSRLKRAAQIPNDSRSRFRTALFVVWLHSVACSRVPHLHMCALIMYTCPQLEASVFWCFHIKKKHSSCILFRGTQVVVLKPADSFAAPCTHAFYTHTHRKPWIFSAGLYYHAETSIGRRAKSLVTTKGLTSRDGNLILIYFSWRILCKQPRMEKGPTAPSASGVASRKCKVWSAFKVSESRLKGQY